LKFSSNSLFPESFFKFSISNFNLFISFCFEVFKSLSLEISLSFDINNVLYSSFSFFNCIELLFSVIFIKDFIFSGRELFIDLSSLFFCFNNACNDFMMST
jgi:hypothetical protein